MVFIKRIYKAFLETGDRLILFLPSSRRQGPLRKMLLVRPDAIGDFILWLDCAKEYRKLYPPDTYSITLMGNKDWESLAARFSCWDDVWTLDRRKFLRNLLYRWAVLVKVRRACFDVVIHPVFSREYFLGDAVIRASGARERIGFSGDLSNSHNIDQKRADGWYTRIIPGQPGVSMELQRNAEFIRALGLAGFGAGVAKISGDFSLPRGFTVRGKYFVVCPAAARPEKQWPVEKFAELTSMIRARTGWEAVICGAGCEASVAGRLKNLAGEGIADYAGKTSLAEFLAIISKADLLIGNDSSCIHIAAAFSVLSVCVAGGGHFGRFVPYDTGTAGGVFPAAVYKRMDCFNCNWKCIYECPAGSPAPCVAGIEVAQAWEAVEALLDQKSKGDMSVPQ